MSSRITRSSARQAASQVAQTNNIAPAAADVPTVPSTTPSSRKRKGLAAEKSPNDALPPSGPSGRRSKRQKIPEAVPPPNANNNNHTTSRSRRKGKPAVDMDSPDNNHPGSAHPAGPSIPSGSSSRKSSRSKKGTGPPSDPTSGTTLTTRRSKRNLDSAVDQDTPMTGTDENKDPGPPPPPPPPIDHHDDDDSEDNDDDEDEEGSRRYDDDEDDDDDDPFGGFGGPPGSLSSTLRALTGMMSGLTSRFREILHNLRVDDLSVQLIALQELSEILLVSNEDNLSGHFSPDAYVKELVSLMNKEESPEIMLLACRCLANLMEALPASVANVVYGSAVPVLCQKLLEISFIDLAEQALSTLEKISVEYPTSIVREGGLTACLSYLDFFATGTQRTAVTTAANCCRNIPEDSFPVVRDVMPTLLNVLNSSDQRVVEQASLCVSGIVESFKYHPSKLEELVSVDLLRGVLRLLVPETLYQILTGVSPPSGTEDVASKLDSVVIMQALIHRPREQIIETLNVICELLPNLPRNADPSYGDFVELQASADPTNSAASGGRNRRSTNEKRIELLEECKDEVRRFALIIFPTLTDAFSSTVNLSVRQKVLTAQLKMLSNLDEDILVEALTPVPYASFLASILSQQDHTSLVMLGLQAAELLLSRLDKIYRYQFYREGVFLEITKIAEEEEAVEEKPGKGEKQESQGEQATEQDNEQSSDQESEHEEDEEDEERESSDDEEDEDEEHDNENGEAQNEDMSPVSSRGSTMSLEVPLHRLVSDVRSMKSRTRDVAKKFLETHETEGHGQAMKLKATAILDALSELAGELETFYLKPMPGNVAADKGKELFTKLASYFDTDVLESVTSAELLASGLVRVLLEVFSNPDEELARAAQSTFLEVFMAYTVKSKPKTATAESPATPFSVMIHKLQDLLTVLPPCLGSRFDFVLLPMMIPKYLDRTVI
uniref:HECT-type E3 ubiquitin transferase n=1 Tax=Fusarium oxysporum (strain Fo5176) TaxID=660025 RepID=A0A0D2XPW2_FUSOF